MADLTAGGVAASCRSLLIACVALACGACGGTAIDDGTILPSDGGPDANLSVRDSGAPDRDASIDQRSPDVVVDVGPVPDVRDASAVPGDTGADVTIDAIVDRSILDARVDVPRPDDGSRDAPVDVTIDGSGCGDCSHLPHVLAGAPVSCRAGQCVVPPGWCETSFAHCTARGEDGCETDTSQSPNCGGCGFVCVQPYACQTMGNTHICGMTCTPAEPDRCSAHCTNFQTSLENCGSCYHNCTDFMPNATPVCSAGMCNVQSCNAGWGDCTADPGCETRLDTAENCGKCGNRACTLPNTTGTCVSGGCGAPVCNPGFANCNTQSSDCETAIDSARPTCWPKYEGTLAVGGGIDLPSIAYLADGSLVIGSVFSRAADFDPSAALDVRTPVGGVDVFVTKVNADGSYAWTRTFGGAQDDIGGAVAAAPDGSIYVVGYFQGVIDLDPGPGKDMHGVNGFGGQPFLVKLDSSGSYVWGASFESSDEGLPGHVAVDSAGNVLWALTYQGSIDVDPGPNVHQVTASNGNGLLVKMSAAGAFMWARSLGGDSCSSGLANLTIAPDDSAWIVGKEYNTCSFGSTDNDPSTDDRGYIAHFSANGDYMQSWKLVGQIDLSSVTLAGDGSIYAGGAFSSTVDFDPGTGTAERFPGLVLNGIDTATSGFLLALTPQGAFRWVQVFSERPLSALAPANDNGAMALTPGLATDHSPLGFMLTKINSDESPGWTISAGTSGTLPSTVIARGGHFAIAGQTDGLADFDPSAGMDVVDRSSAAFVSRYAF